MKQVYSVFLVISIFFVFSGCGEDSPEYVLNEFFRKVQENQGAQAFLDHVDLVDFMTILGYVPEPELKNEDEIKTKFLNFWEKNKIKIASSLLDKIKETEDIQVERKSMENEDIIMLIKTTYKDGTQKQEEVLLKKSEKTFKIIFSSLKEV